ncbi:MAG: hypothetical protein KGO96_13665 [Elusimicrobia bacterium]|nr:hypothetical protein [Elusimicrobiota bacterium]MDE2236264.1 hypothetical protein [Elusimicrobiota bacterium]MDE2426942.1 hypothetical protein [Elusimicrobiota bacterium]
MSVARLTHSTGPNNGLVAKLGAIKEGYEESLRYPAVRAFAERAAMGPLGRPSLLVLFANLRSVYRYLPDPVGVELIKSPHVMVSEIKSRGWTAGDCDDAASLVYGLLNLLGVPARLAVGWKPGQSSPSHIWVRVPETTGNFVEFDLTKPIFNGPKSGYEAIREYA